MTWRFHRPTDTVVPTSEKRYRGRISELHLKGWGRIRSGRSSVFFWSGSVSDPDYRFDDLTIGMCVRFTLRERNGRRDARGIEVLP